MENLLAILILVAFLLFIEGIYFFLRDRQVEREKKVRQRLVKLGGEIDGKKVSILRKKKLSTIPALDMILRNSGFFLHIDASLEEAGSEMKVDLFLVTSIACCVAAAVALLTLGQARILVGGGALFGLFLPYLFLKRKIKKRSEKITAQLPDTLELMTRSLRAGHALSTSFHLVAQEMPEPIATEFGKAFEHQKLGMPMEEALNSMVERTPNNMDMKIFVVSVLIQHETGGNLTEILENISYTIRERFKIKGHVKALTGEGRLSGWILGLLPVVMALVLLFVNPEYMNMLLDDRIGRMMLAGGVTMQLMGALVIRKIVNIKI